MAILKVARAGHPVLRQLAAAVSLDELRQAQTQLFIDNLLETMDEYDGAGLAAPQVYTSKRIVALTLDDEIGPTIWVNPVVTPLGDELVATYEGCLSLPGLRAAVPRHSKVSVTALDRDGNTIELILDGFSAIVAQHECDHLDGVLYIDRADPQTFTFLEEYRRFGPWPLDEPAEDTSEAL